MMMVEYKFHKILKYFQLIPYSQHRRYSSCKSQLGKNQNQNSRSLAKLATIIRFVLADVCTVKCILFSSTSYSHFEIQKKKQAVESKRAWQENKK
jgi:hypothetical protein